MRVFEIASQIHERISVSAIRAEDYVSTDNMRPNFGGIEPSSSLPPSGNVTAYQVGDILLSNIRPYFRKTWLATHGGGCNADVLCIRADPEKCVPQYLYYLLTTDNFVTDYLKSCKGAKMPRGDVNRLLNYEFHLPDLPTQLRIAGVLGSLDEKIELNRKKIAELEALAKTIYDYWFVQFDFPDKNGKPYKSSGGKMVWNEQLKREVPEGWEVGTIHSICDLLVGGTPSKKVSDYWNGSIPFWGPTDCSDSIFQFHTAEQITDSGFAHCSSDMIPENSTVITARGSIGKVAMVGVKMAMNQSCFAFHSNDGEDVFLYYLAKQLVNHLKQTSTGSVFNAFVSSDLKNVILSLGNKSVRHLYSQIADGVFMQIKTLVQQINELINLRDTLLPLLMNGQVVVK